MTSVSPTLKIPATIYSYTSGRHTAACGVLSCDGSTAKQARDQLADDLLEILCDPVKLLRLAAGACQRNPDEAPRKDVDAVLAELCYRRPPTRVRATQAEVIEPALPALKIVTRDEVRAGMLIVFERQGGHPWPAFQLGLVGERTPNYKGAKPMLWVDIPQDSRNLEHWNNPDDRDWCCGTWWNHEHDVGEIHVLAEDVPRGISGADLRALAEQAGWPGAFASRTAQLGARAPVRPRCGNNGRRRLQSQPRPNRNTGQTNLVLLP